MKLLQQLQSWIVSTPKMSQSCKTFEFGIS